MSDDKQESFWHWNAVCDFYHQLGGVNPLQRLQRSLQPTYEIAHLAIQRIKPQWTWRGCQAPNPITGCNYTVDLNGIYRLLSLLQFRFKFTTDQCRCCVWTGFLRSNVFRSYFQLTVNAIITTRHLRYHAFIGSRKVIFLCCCACVCVILDCRIKSVYVDISDLFRALRVRFPWTYDQMFSKNTVMDTTWLFWWHISTKRKVETKPTTVLDYWITFFILIPRWKQQKEKKKPIQKDGTF